MAANNNQGSGSYYGAGLHGEPIPTMVGLAAAHKESPKILAGLAAKAHSPQVDADVAPKKIAPTAAAKLANPAAKGPSTPRPPSGSAN